jgi:hypothetical protein
VAIDEQYRQAEPMSLVRNLPAAMNCESADVSRHDRRLPNPRAARIAQGELDA